MISTVKPVKSTCFLVNETKNPNDLPERHTSIILIRILLATGTTFRGEKQINEQKRTHRQNERQTRKTCSFWRSRLDSLSSASAAASYLIIGAMALNIYIRKVTAGITHTNVTKSQPVPSSLSNLKPAFSRKKGARSKAPQQQKKRLNLWGALPREPPFLFCSLSTLSFFRHETHWHGSGPVRRATRQYVCNIISHFSVSRLSTFFCRSVGRSVRRAGVRGWHRVM